MAEKDEKKTTSTKKSSSSKKTTSSSTKKSTSKKQTTTQKVGKEVAKEYKKMSPAAKIALILVIVLIVIAVVTICVIFREQLVALFKPNDSNTGGNGDNQTVLPKGEGELRITYIDVGQGDCILIQLPDGKNMLVDAGTSMKDDAIEDRATNFIKNSVKKEDGTLRLDYVMLTHQDEDHISFMAKVVEEFEIGTLYTPMLVDREFKNWQDELIGEANYTAEGYGISTTLFYKNYLDVVKTRKDNGKLGEVVYSEAGQQISEDGASYEMKILAPKKEMYAKPAGSTIAYKNNTVSPIFILRYEDVKVLFTGDATGHNSPPSVNSNGGFNDGTLGGTEKQFIEYVTENNLQDYVDCDVMKLGHHGSQSSSSKEFLQLVKPEYAVICVGAAEYESDPKAYTADQDICYEKDGTAYHSKYCLDHGIICKEFDLKEGNTHGLPNKDVIARVRQYTDLTPDTDEDAYLTDDDRIYATDELGDITLSIMPQKEGKGTINFSFELEKPDFAAMEEQLKANLTATFIYNNPFTIQNLLAA